MNNKLFTAGEIATIQTNLNKIEKSLNRPIPGGIIDASELKDHIFSAGEVVTICSNIERITRSQYIDSRRESTTDDSNLETTIGLIILGVTALLSLFGVL